MSGQFSFLIVNMKKTFLLLLILSCTGCSGLNIFSSPVERLPLQVYNPKKLNMKKVEFIVIHRKNAEEVFNKMEERGEQPVLIGLSGDNYKNLSLNTEDIKEFMIIQKDIIEAYRKYYESEDFKKLIEESK